MSSTGLDARITCWCEGIGLFPDGCEDALDILLMP